MRPLLFYIMSPSIDFLCPSLIPTAPRSSASTCLTIRPIRGAQTAEAEASSMTETRRARVFAASRLILRSFLGPLARDAVVRDCQETFRKYPQKSAIPSDAAPCLQFPRPARVPGPPMQSGTWLGAALPLYQRLLSASPPSPSLRSGRKLAAFMVSRLAPDPARAASQSFPH